MDLLQGGSLRPDYTFLGYRQQTASIRHRFDGVTLTIWLGSGYYFLYFFFGIAFGPYLTFALLDHASLGTLLIGGFFNIIGYAILVSSLFVRRWITIDFARREISFFTRFITRSQTTISFDEIASFRLRRDVCSSDDRPLENANRQFIYVLSIENKSNQKFDLVESIRRRKIEEIVDLLSSELHSRIPLNIEVPPATPEELQANEDSKGIARFALPALILALISLGTFFMTGYDIYLACSARNWPSTTSQILLSRTFRDLTPDRHNVVKLSYQVQMRYRYRVDGKSYENDRVSFDAHDRATTSIRFPTGAMPAVFYNPKNPQIAVLDRTLSSWTYAFFTIALLLLISYGVYVYTFPANRRRRNTTSNRTTASTSTPRDL